MEYLLNNFLKFLNYFEEARRISYEYLREYSNKREKVLINGLLDFESKLKVYNPLTIVIGFFFIFFLMRFLLKISKRIWRNINSIEQIKITFYNFILMFGFAKKKLEKTREEIKESCREQFKVKQFKKLKWETNSQDYQKILQKLRSFNDVDKTRVGEKDTKITGSVYLLDSGIENLVGEVVKMYGYSNLLHPDIFCSARFIESELINIGIELFNGNKEKTCGLTTTGGSTSILMACLSYRNRAYKLGIKHPELIIPITAHAAFVKAGEAFNIKIVKIPLDSNYQVDIKKVKSAINKNTCGLVGSFPNFPHGCCDNIEALSELAVRYNVPLHVDACLGGLLVAFYQSANIEIPKFDFRLPGVTSISADYHKYGLCPKGISILLYKDREYRKNQYFIYPHFMGGIYPSPGLEGSRSPAMAVASYAILIHLGKNTYINQAKKIHEAVKEIKKFIRENMKEIEIIGNPQICSVACKGPKAVLIHDKMEKKGWHINLINNPMGFSFVVTSANLANVVNKSFMKDLKDSYDSTFTKEGSILSESTKLYGLSLNLPESLVRDNMDIVCDTMLD